MRYTEIRVDAIFPRFSHNCWADTTQVAALQVVQTSSQVSFLGGENSSHCPRSTSKVEVSCSSGSVICVESVGALPTTRECWLFQTHRLETEGQCVMPIVWRRVQMENRGLPSIICNSNFGRSSLRQRLARCLVRYRSEPPSALSLRSSGRGIQTNSVSKVSLVR